MIVWMRRHAPRSRATCGPAPPRALASGSVWALVAMAFFAVLREGLETAVFLLAAFQASGDAPPAGPRRPARDRWSRSRSGSASTAAACASTSPASSASPRPCSCSSPPASSRARCTPRTRPPGSTASRPRRRPRAGSSRPGRSSSSLAHGRARDPAAARRSARSTGWLLYAIPMLIYVLWPAGAEQCACQARSPPRLNSKAHLIAAALVTGSALALPAAVVSRLRVAAPVRAPDRGSDGGGKAVAVTLSDDGCSPAKVTIPAGAVTFNVSNGGSGEGHRARAQNEHGLIIGERENVVEGINGSFSLNLQPGQLHAQLPERRHHARRARCSSPATASPTATGASAALLTTATAGYKRLHRCRDARSC